VRELLRRNEAWTKPGGEPSADERALATSSLSAARYSGQRVDGDSTNAMVETTSLRSPALAMERVPATRRRRERADVFAARRTSQPSARRRDSPSGDEPWPASARRARTNSPTPKCARRAPRLCRARVHACAIPRHLRELRGKIRRFTVPPRRSERRYPRAVKSKMSGDPKKRRATTNGEANPTYS